METRAIGKDRDIPFISIASSIAHNPLITSDFMRVACQGANGMRHAMPNIYQCHAAGRFDWSLCTGDSE